MDDISIEEFEQMVQARADLENGVEEMSVDDFYRPFDFQADPENQDNEVLQMVEAFLRDHPAERRGN